MSPQVIAETKQWLAVNKPASLTSDQQWDHPSVQGWSMDYLLQKGVKKPYIGLVHRLDRTTSGLLLVAKKKSALRTLNEQFRDRKVTKIYWALVTGKLPETTATLKHYLRKDQANKRAEIFSQAKSNTQEVQLRYRVLGHKNNISWLEIELLTGKFHQIRAQLSTEGCPIIGDERYGSKENWAPNAIALHAQQLSFTDPGFGEQISLYAPPPDRWQSYLSQF